LSRKVYVRGKEKNNYIDGQSECVVVDPKLVRDRIPEIIRKDGRKPVTHLAKEEEYFARLREKLTEEVAEFSRDWEVEELADILEVVYALAEAKGVARDGLERMRMKKAGERGRFRRRIILDDIR
jgi:predicted house-cleaning noncanonical NTP pyrophosphatase (MazG superfamily)